MSAISTEINSFVSSLISKGIYKSENEAKTDIVKNIQKEELVNLLESRKEDIEKGNFKIIDDEYNKNLNLGRN